MIVLLPPPTWKTDLLSQWDQSGQIITLAVNSATNFVITYVKGVTGVVCSLP